MNCTLVAQARKNNKGSLEVFKVIEEQGKQKKILISKKPSITEYVNGIQMYNTSMSGEQFQSYFEQDPFNSRQNEVIKIAERNPRVQVEYSIMKDVMTSRYITDYIYKNHISKEFKNGTKSFPLLEFFSTVSTETEIRECYSMINTGEPLVNPLNFKDLAINKWDRVNWLKKKRIINI